MSNPIASETEPECATDGCDGTPRYCMLCHVGISPSARTEPTSDPSGKGAEQEALDAALLLHDKVVETTGYSSRNVIPILAAALGKHAASLRQQLSDSQGKVSQLEASRKFSIVCFFCGGMPR